MSNDPAVTDPTATTAGLLLLIGLIAWTIVGGLLLWRVGLFRGRTILGPDRLAPQEHAVLLAIQFLVAIAFGSLASVATFKAFDPAAQWRPYVATVAFSAVATATVLAANALLRRDGIGRLGLAPGMLPRGLRDGAIGIIAAMPVVLVVGIVMNVLIALMNWPRPEAHDLLKSLGLTEGPGGMAFLVLMAVVVAPVFEEVLFRGLVQTFLVRVLGGRPLDPPVGGLEVVGAEPAASTTAAFDDSPMARVALTEAIAPPVRLIVARWAAIAITAMLFALVHGEAAFVPSLFVLAVALGYAYEATGNLWVPILMHALFNGFQITLFLSGVAS